LPPVPRWQTASVSAQSIAFTLDSRSLVTANSTEIVVWDAANGQREISIPRPDRRPTDSADSGHPAVLIMSPIDRRAIVYGAGGARSDRPFLVELDSGKFDALPSFADMVPGDDPVIGFLPDGRTAFQLAVSLVADGGEVVLRLWDLPDGPWRVVPFESRLYHDWSFSADGRRAVAVLNKVPPVPGTIQILDVAGARITQKLRFNRKVLRATLSADGRSAAVSTCPIYEGGAQGFPEVELWDAESGQRVATLGAGLAQGWNRAGRLVVLDGTTAKLLRVPDGAELRRWPAPQHSGVFCGDMSADGHFLIIEHSHFLPNTVSWLLQRLPGNPFDPDESTILVSIFDAETGRELAAIEKGARNKVSLAPNGSALAVAGAGGLRLYTVPSQTPAGIVLALMIAEVALLIAWTAWRRRFFRRRRLVANS
jgi:hypothetical protein